jgi:predicted alpha/beta-hydrolase family hydrolase
LAEQLAKGAVSGFLHRPAANPLAGLVLTHGAGGNCQAPLLVDLANRFASQGLCVLRCDLPFRQKRKSGSPRPAEASEDRQGLKAAAEELHQICSTKIFLGGLSYGGRQATILASEDQGVAAGLLLLSYPLHPPGKPAQLRTAHFPDLHLRCLFIHGTKDPFGSIAEMRSALPLIPAKTELLEIEGAGHDLKRGQGGVSQKIVDRFLATDVF